MDEMFTNCDFSAAERAALLQKATALTASQLQQAHKAVLLEKATYESHATSD